MVKPADRLKLLVTLLTKYDRTHYTLMKVQEQLGFIDIDESVITVLKNDAGLSEDELSFVTRQHV